MCAKGPEDWIAMDALGSYCSASDREEEERYNAGLGCRNEMEGGGGDEERYRPPSARDERETELI